MKMDNSKENVKIKNSYYTFSKEYPASSIRKSKSKKDPARFLKITIFIIFLLIFVVFGYFLFSIAANISSKPYSSDDFAVSADDKLNVFSDNFKAYQLARGDVANENKIESLIKTIKWNDANSVVVDFKNSDGTLLHSSASYFAANNHMYDNNTIRRMIQLFHNKNIFVVAKFSCFKDNLAAEADPNMAIKFEDTEVNWVDSELFSWLDPYSKDAQAYLLSLLGELSDFGVDGVILSDLSFPYSGDIQSAFYKSAGKKASKQKALLNFKAKVDEVFADSSIYLTAEQGILDYDPFDSALPQLSSHVVFDVSSAPEGYSFQNKDDYTSVISLMSRLKSNSGVEDAAFILPSVYSGKKSVKFLKNSGFSSVIIQ